MREQNRNMFRILIQGLSCFVEPKQSEQGEFQQSRRMKQSEVGFRPGTECFRMLAF